LPHSWVAVAHRLVLSHLLRGVCWWSRVCGAGNGVRRPPGGASRGSGAARASSPLSHPDCGHRTAFEPSHPSHLLCGVCGDTGAKGS